MSHSDDLHDAVCAVVRDELDNFDFSDVFDVDQSITDAMVGTQAYDWFDMSDYVTSDEIDERVSEALATTDSTPDGIEDLTKRVEAIERLFAHAHGALTHLAHIAGQVNTHATSPEA